MFCSVDGESCDKVKAEDCSKVDCDKTEDANDHCTKPLPKCKEDISTGDGNEAHYVDTGQGKEEEHDPSDVKMDTAEDVSDNESLHLRLESDNEGSLKNAETDKCDDDKMEDEKSRHIQGSATLLVHSV